MCDIGYELVNAEDYFDDDNNGLIFGIHWLDNGIVVDCEWFKTEEERQKCIDIWYADEQDIFTPEQ
jgi:hypothetical protein